MTPAMPDSNKTPRSGTTPSRQESSTIVGKHALFKVEQ